MNKLKSLSALYLVLIITIETISAVQFLPFLINRRSPNRLDHHKLLKEINELDYSHDLATKQPTNYNTLTVESAPAQLVSSVAKKHPVSRKRDFNLDDFTLADLLSLNDEQAPPIGRGESGIMAPTLASSPAVNVGRSRSTTGSSPATQSPRSMNACDKTRVAAGTSGYMRLSCMDGLSTTTRGPSASALTDMRASLLHQLDNAQFRRMNSNFEQLVDALRSGAGTSWPST